MIPLKLAKKAVNPFNTSEMAALLQQVHAEPREHANRAILADWLEENGLHHDTATLRHLRNTDAPAYIGAHAGKVWAGPHAPLDTRRAARDIDPGGEHRLRFVHGPRGTFMASQSANGRCHEVHEVEPVGDSFQYHHIDRSHRRTAEYFPTREAALTHARRLATAPEVARMAKVAPDTDGWIAPDGTWHSNGRLSHIGRAGVLGFGKNAAHQVSYDAHQAGYTHVAEDEGILHGYHPEGTYTGMQVERLKKLARAAGTEAELHQVVGGKPRTRVLKLAKKNAAYEGDAELAQILRSVRDNPHDVHGRLALSDALEERPELLHHPETLHHLRNLDTPAYLGGHKGKVWVAPHPKMTIHDMLPAGSSHHQRSEEDLTRDFRVHLIHGPRGNAAIQQATPAPGAPHIPGFFHAHLFVPGLRYPTYIPATRTAMTGQESEVARRGGFRTRAAAFAAANKAVHAPPPARLAKKPQTVGNLTLALQDLSSKNQKARNYVAKQIIQQSGDPGNAHDVIAYHPRTGYRASVLTTLQSSPAVAPHLAPYLGAYQGLLSSDHAIVAFVSGNGADTLHHIHVNSPIAEATQSLLAAGVSSFSAQPTPTGTLMHIFDPGSTMNLGGFNGSVSSTQGTGTRLSRGEGTDADARASYRHIISSAERAAGGATAGGSAAPAAGGAPAG